MDAAVYSGQRLSTHRTRGDSILLIGGSSLLALYLGISPVYWLPGVGVGLLAGLKLGLVATAVLSIYAHCLVTHQFRLPVGAVGLLGFLAMIIASMPGFLQADVADSITRAIDVVLCFVFMWCFYNLQRASGESVRILRLATLIIFVFSIPTITSAIYGIPDWVSPLSRNRMAFFSTGFGAGRTGWSNGIGLFVPLALTLLAPDKSGRRPRFGFLAFCVVALVLIASQTVCGGRAGLVASVVVVVVSSFFSASRGQLLVFAAVLVGLSVVLTDYLSDQLRLSAMTSEVRTVEQIDRLSTGRVGGYLVAMDLISERPLAGHGFGTVELADYGIKYKEVHNLWLRMAVESGLLLPITLIFVVVAIPRRYVRRFGGFRRVMRSIRSQPGPLSLVLVFLAGLIISMFEPNALVGSFQNTAVWWAAAGTLLAGSNDRDASIPVTVEPPPRISNLR